MSAGLFSNYFNSSCKMSRKSFGGRFKGWMRRRVLRFLSDYTKPLPSGRCRSLCHEVVGSQMGRFHCDLSGTSVLCGWWSMFISFFRNHGQGIRRFVSDFSNCSCLVWRSRRRSRRNYMLSALRSVSGETSASNGIRTVASERTSSLVVADAAVSSGAFASVA